MTQLEPERQPQPNGTPPEDPAALVEEETPQSWERKACQHSRRRCSLL